MKTVTKYENITEQVEKNQQNVDFVKLFLYGHYFHKCLIIFVIEKLLTKLL